MNFNAIANPYDLAGLNVAGNVESHGDNLVGEVCSPYSVSDAQESDNSFTFAERNQTLV